MSEDNTPTSLGVDKDEAWYRTRRRVTGLYTSSLMEKPLLGFKYVEVSLEGFSAV